MGARAMSPCARAFPPPGATPRRGPRHLALLALSLGLLGPAAPAQADPVAFSGTLTLCVAGCDYDSLTNEGGLFQAINAAGLSGDLVIDVAGDLTGELGTHALEEWVEEGVGGYTLLIRPSGGPRTISGSHDRRAVPPPRRGPRPDRRLHRGHRGPGRRRRPRPSRADPPKGTSTGELRLRGRRPAGANGARNNTLKNLVILGQSAATTKAGIALGGNTPGTPGTDNDGNRVENCAVRRAQFGIYSAGHDASNPNSGTVITRNDLAATGADAIGRGGIIVFLEDGIEITENRVGGLVSERALRPDRDRPRHPEHRSELQSVSDFPVTNALVARNRIDGIALTSRLGRLGRGHRGGGRRGRRQHLGQQHDLGGDRAANPANLVTGHPRRSAPPARRRGSTTTRWRSPATAARRPGRTRASRCR